MSITFISFCVRKSFRASASQTLGPEPCKHRAPNAYIYVAHSQCSHRKTVDKRHSKIFIHSRHIAYIYDIYTNMNGLELEMMGTLNMAGGKSLMNKFISLIGVKIFLTSFACLHRRRSSFASSAETYIKSHKIV